MFRIVKNLTRNLKCYSSFNILSQNGLKFLRICLLPQARNGHFSRPVNTVKYDKLTTLRDILTNNNRKTHELDWKSIRQDLIHQEKNVNEVNVDAVILGSCNSSDHLDIAKSYIKFLRNEGLEINYASVGRLLKVYYLAYKIGKLSEEDKREILTFYKSIRAKNEIIDPITCEYLIYGLIACDKLEVSMELLDMIKLTCKPNGVAYSTVISKAFETEDTFPEGWTVLNDMISNGRLPKCEIFLEYFKSIKRNPKIFMEKLEQMLHFIGEHKIVVSEVVIENLQRNLKELGYTTSIAKLSKNGQCDNCGNNMENVSTTLDEFERLSSSFLEKVLIRKDVFQKSSPGEVERFMNFIEKSGPFDCVIDGLNVAFSSGTHKSPSVFAKYLASVVRHLSKSHKRLLIIGRKHMQLWPKQQVNQIQRSSKIFFADNITHDDPFLLYAALRSGPKTDFVSRDLMRSHAYLLGPDLKNIFKRWQQEHQYSLITIKNNNDVLLQEPIKYNLYAHKVGNTWHVPFQKQYSATPGDSLTIPSSWLCISQ